jgi:hypothetical protein
VDFISFLPLFLLSHKLSGANQWVKLLKLPQVINFVWSFPNVITRKTSKNKKTKEILTEYNLSFKTNTQMLYLQIITNTISVHFMACLVYFIPMTFSPDVNWVVLRELHNKSPLEKYLYSLHWIIQTFTTVGYGETPIT